MQPSTSLTGLPVCSWLIAIAYWLSGGFIKSGLGNRIAYAIVSVFGKTTLGLTYSLVFAEALLAPAIPSVRPWQLAQVTLSKSMQPPPCRHQPDPCFFF